MKAPGRAARAVLTIGAGTAVAQALTVLAAPVISRIFTPSEVGVYTVIAAVAAIVAAVAPLRWEFGVTLPDNEHDAHAVNALGLLSAAAICLVSFIAVVVLGQVGALGELWPWMLLMPVAAFAQGALKVLNQLAIRHRRYRAIAIRALTRSSSIVATQIGLGLAGLKTSALVIGLAIGNCVGVIGLLRGSGIASSDGRIGRSRSLLAQNARRFRRFPLYLAPASLINVLGTQLPVLLIAGLYGQQVAGWLGLTLSATALPAAVISQSIAQVYIGEISASIRVNRSNIYPMFKRASLSLAAPAAAILAGLTIGAPFLFPIVFGERWTTSGIYAAALAPGIAMQMIAVPTSQTLSLLGRQHVQLAWDIGRLVAAGSTVVVMATIGTGATSTVASVGAVTAISYSLLWWLARHAILTQTSETDSLYPHIKGNDET